MGEPQGNTDPGGLAGEVQTGQHFFPPHTAPGSGWPRVTHPMGSLPSSQPESGLRLCPSPSVDSSLCRLSPCRELPGSACVGKGAQVEGDNDLGPGVGGASGIPASCACWDPLQRLEQQPFPTSAPPRPQGHPAECGNLARGAKRAVSSEEPSRRRLLETQAFHQPDPGR